MQLVVFISGCFCKCEHGGATTSGVLSVTSTGTVSVIQIVSPLAPSRTIAGCVAGLVVGTEYETVRGRLAISFTTTAAPPISRIINKTAAAVAFVFEMAIAITAPFAREIAAPLPLNAAVAAADANVAGA